MTGLKIRTIWVGAAAAAVLLFTGCAAETPEASGSSPIENTSTSARGGNSTEAPKTETPSEAPGARKQAEDCNWEGAPVSSASIPALPTGTDGDLNSVLVGTWQHTHIDSGAGYEPLIEEDIRFVFPSSDRLLYCQHVPGITEYAENAANITWDGNTLIAGGTTRLYTVESWNADTMVMINEIVDSRYLLQRH